MPTLARELTRNSWLNRLYWHQKTVNEQTQAVLAAALAHIRDMRNAESGDISLRIAYAGGVIAGLEDTGALTSVEAGEWKRRLDELRHETDASADDPTEPHPDSDRSGANARFLRLIPGPFEVAFFDGHLRVVVLELFADRLSLYWHIAMPSVESILGADAVALNRDIGELPSDTQDMEKRIAVQMRLHSRQFVLTDGVGTKFRAVHSTGGGSQGEEWGVRVFVPAVPAGASTLHLQFHEAHLSIPLK